MTAHIDWPALAEPVARIVWATHACDGTRAAVGHARLTLPQPEAGAWDYFEHGIGGGGSPILCPAPTSQRACNGCTIII